MDELCQKCRTTISRRAKANIWNGTHVVCTPCLKKLQAAVMLEQNLLGMIGKAYSPWLVHDGRHQQGPFTTEQMIKMLTKGQVKWDWKVWREGMKEWTPAAYPFTVPGLGRGKVELRDFGQGDGTYRP